MKINSFEMKKAIMSVKDAHGPIAACVEKSMKGKKPSDFCLNSNSSVNAASLESNPFFQFMKSIEPKYQIHIDGGLDTKV